MNPEGNELFTKKAMAVRINNNGNVMSFLETVWFNTLRYPPIPLSKPELNLSNTLWSHDFWICFSCSLVSINAQSAGVKVKATNPESTILDAMVIENWR